MYLTTTITTIFYEKWNNHQCCNHPRSLSMKVTDQKVVEIKRNVQHVNNRNHEQRNQSIPSKPNEGMNTQPVRDNANVFQSFNLYAKAVLGNNDACNSGEKPVGVSVSNKANEEWSNEALMFISEDDCIDFDGMERSILAKVKDLSVITDLLKYMSSEGFVDVGLRYVGGRWVWLKFDSTDQVESVKNSKVLNELFLELKDVSYDFIPDERCVWIDLVGLPLASWAPEVYKKLGGRWGCSVFTDMVNDGPMSHGKVCVLTESLHRVLESFKVSYRNRSYCITATEFAYWAPNIESTEDKSMTDSLERKDDEGPSLDGGSEHEEPLDVDNCDSVSSKDDNNDSDSSSEMSSTSRLMREVDVRGVDSDHVDSFEEGEIIGDSVLNNDGCVKDCMEKNLDDDVEKDIEDCSKNVTEKCGVVNNNMSNNVEGEILEDHFDGDRGNDTIEDNADLNPSTNVYLDVNQNTSIPEVVEDLSSLDRSSDKAERLAHHNNGLDDLDISLRNRLLHQDKCRVRSVKAAVNDSSIVSPSTPPGNDLNIAKESCSTWLDYVGPLITDELDSEKRWSYRDPKGNIQGSFSLAQLHMWKDYFPSDLQIWSYYGNVKETILLHSALKRRTKDAG
ncbi:5-oxoprolinase-like protein [Tanacetum coccineum]